VVPVDPAEDVDRHRGDHLIAWSRRSSRVPPYCASRAERNTGRLVRRVTLPSILNSTIAANRSPTAIAWVKPAAHRIVAARLKSPDALLAVPRAEVAREAERSVRLREMQGGSVSNPLPPKSLGDVCQHCGGSTVTPKPGEESAAAVHTAGSLVAVKETAA
jgi:hypothetical protein